MGPVAVGPPVSAPASGETGSSLAGAVELMLNFTGPPVAVRVNDPVYEPPVADRLSTTWVAEAVKVPGDGGVRDGVGDGDDDRLRDADGLGGPPGPAGGVGAAGRGGGR